jgi:transposase
MFTRVILGLASSTNSSIVLRKMSANIQKVQRALQDLKEKKYCSIRQAALANDVGKSTIAYRLHGRKSRTQSSSSSRRLTSEQEEVLIKWVEDRQRQILPLNHTTLRELVIQLLQENDDFEPLGKLWTTRFIQRHPPLVTGRGRTIDIQRLMALDPNIIKVYFNKVEELRKLYNIESEDEYNIDEKGFQIGQAGGEAVIINKS